MRRTSKRARKYNREQELKDTHGAWWQDYLTY